MIERYASILQVADALEKCRKQSDKGVLYVWDTDEAVMRGITKEEVERRNIPMKYSICRIEWRSAGYLSLKFHENQITGTFELTPAGPDAIYPTQASQPENICSTDLSRVVNQINYAFDIGRWSFCSVDAASIAHAGHPTDYEFEYEAVI